MQRTLPNALAIGLGLLLALSTAGCNDGGSGSPADAGDRTRDAGNDGGSQDAGNDGGSRDGDTGGDGGTDGGLSGSSALPRPELPRPPRDGLPSELRPPR